VTFVVVHSLCSTSFYFVLPFPVSQLPSFPPLAMLPLHRRLSGLVRAFALQTEQASRKIGLFRQCLQVRPKPVNYEIEGSYRRIARKLRKVVRELKRIEGYMPIESVRSKEYGNRVSKSEMKSTGKELTSVGELGRERGKSKGLKGYKI